MARRTLPGAGGEEDIAGLCVEEEWGKRLVEWGIGIFGCGEDGDVGGDVVCDENLKGGS